MKKIARNLSAFVLATVGCVSTALGAAGSLTPSITAVSETVTFSSDGLQTYIGFTFKFTNSGGNTINGVTATFSTSVSDKDNNNPFQYSAALYLASNPLPPGCVKTSDASFACSIMQLKSGESFPGTGSFTVFYQTPSKSAQDLTPELTYAVKLAGSFVYAEGTNGNNPVGQPSTITCATDPTICPATALGTENPTLVISAVPSSGANLTTGLKAVPKPGAYPFAAQVVIPSLTAVFQKPAKIELSVPINPSPTVCINSSQLATCREANIDISEFSQNTSNGHLEITLRFAASEVIGKPVKPEAINVIYFKDDQTSLGNVNAILCTGFGTSNVTPRADLPPDTPCVASRTYYKNKSVPGYTDDLAGVVELVFFVRKNGNWTTF